MENLNVEFLTGTPFMETNDVAIRPACCEVIVRNDPAYHYGSTGNCKSDSTL